MRAVCGSIAIAIFAGCGGEIAPPPASIDAPDSAVEDADAGASTCGPRHTWMRDVDGSGVLPAIRKRPWTATDDGGAVAIGDWQMHDFHETAPIEIVTVTAPHDASYDNPLPIAFGSVLLKNVELFDVTDTGLITVDADRILDTPTDVTIEDATLHDAPRGIWVSRAHIGTLTLNRVSMERVDLDVLLDLSAEGSSVDRLVIVDSPGIEVVAIGNPSVGAIEVHRSPGVKLQPVFADRTTDDGLPCGGE